MATLKFTSTLLVLVFFSAFCSLETSADKAIPLITVKKNHGDSEDQFVLNPDAIAKIKKLSSPVKVISAIGDARVGKSTALNFIHYTLGKADFSAVNEEEIFETGNTMDPVTRGVWLSTISGKQGMGNVLLLDVEGTDLGDDTVTDKLSIFTVLMSSGLTLFMKQSPSTHITDFLYKIVRLSEQAFGKEDSDHFPHLTAVLRGALKPPKGYDNINQYIIDALITPKWNDKSDDKRKAIGKRFPSKRITVFNLPLIPSSYIFKNFSELSNSEYLKDIETLTSNLMKLPEKKSLKGVVMDGQTLANLAEKLMEVMNDHRAWSGLNPSFYHLFEKEICRQSAREYIEPLLALSTSHRIESNSDWFFDQFKKKCNLEDERTSANRRIQLTLKRLNEIEKREFEQRTIERIARIKKEEESKWLMNYVYGVATGAAGVAAGIFFLSDHQLKENVTLLNDSEYETIGLRGVGWVWNKEAERLGLSGRGSGVVAQEVELLYPWAVTEGHDGYKRVNYLALRLLIAKKCGRLDTQTYKVPNGRLATTCVET